MIKKDVFHPFNWISDKFTKEQKKINIFGIPQNIGQAKYITNILNELDDSKNYTDTAVVLADENLLIPVLQSVPETISNINVTMGYPLKNTPTNNFFEIYFNTLVNAERFGNKESLTYHYKDLLKFFQLSFSEIVFGKENCNDVCWACEYQNNGTDWSNLDSARATCEESESGCIFRQDNNSFNGYGWCDMDWDKTGNCDENCWECWDSEKCSETNAGCKWFVDPYNDNNAWCDDKNVKTCSDDCYMCWDQDNCQNSDADCTWDTNSWFCKPQGSGEGEESEICFDGVDNDADNFIDCEDPECMFDSFCGGSQVFGSNCPSISNEITCLNQTDCVWITDAWNNSWCDMQGAQCWVYDDNQNLIGTKYFNAKGL